MSTAPPLQHPDFQQGMLRRTKSLKVVLLLLCFLTLFLLFVIVKHSPEGVKRSSIQEKRIVPKMKQQEKLSILHLDFKGAPPKMPFVLETVRLAHRAGANGLLIEYEDMFPWSGKLKNISAGNSYSLEEVKNLLNLAKALEMEVIPLVQTFGHLEFVLKLAEFRHLRELDSFPQELCPSKEDAFLLIKELIRQVMEVHKEVKYLHIGCDEVYHIAACPICSQRNARTVFISQVMRVAQHVRTTYYGVTPIIWDDMMRRWSPIDIQDSGLGEVVEPMVWVYIDDLTRLVPHFIWYTYKKTFHNLWGASAFKGAFGEKETLPDLPRHFENNLAWQRLIWPADPSSTTLTSADIRGIAVTGWSRYDHFAVLSELLPLSIPSMVLAFATSHAYNNGARGMDAEALAIETTLQTLDCPKPYPFATRQEMKNDVNQWAFAACNFSGNILYQKIQQFYMLKERYDKVMSLKNSNGWVSEYNVRYKYSSPYRVLELFTEEGFAAKRLQKDLERFKGEVLVVLKKFFDDFTGREWVEQKLEPMEENLKGLEMTFQELVERKTWLRRPLISAGT